ncbi:hypothetical protein BDR26DRAFT_1003769 [Obelidium mucronatum]|nr:hypothetical protein BDR26DRAFT_1003769 [Obelidium mucronatum]
MKSWRTAVGVLRHLGIKNQPFSKSTKQSKFAPMSDRIDLLTTTLPLSAADVLSRTATLSAKQRGAFAARLVLDFKNHPKFRPLVKELLHTEKLPGTIPVQTEAVDAPSDDWDLVSNVGTLELTNPQTTACKNLLTRSIGIAMAVSAKDEELLTEICEHPSENMKARAKTALQAIRSEKNATPNSVVYDHQSEFAAYFQAIREAPATVPPGSSIKTRNIVWHEFSEEKWNLKAWSNGSLRSISDPTLRNYVADNILTLAMEYPFFEIINKNMVPVMPALIRKNLKQLFKFDAPRTIAFVCTTITRDTKHVESVILPSIFQRKVDFWSRQVEEDKVALIEPILVAVAQSKDPKKKEKFNVPLLSTILLGRPVKAVLDHLFDAAVRDAHSVIEDYSSKIGTEDNPVSVTQKFISDLQSGFGYILMLLKEYHRRVLGTATFKLRKDAQDLFEESVKKAMDDLLAIFAKSIEAMPTATDSRIADPKSLFQEFRKKESKYKRDWLLIPLFGALNGHPELALHLYNSVRKGLTTEDVGLVHQVFSCLRSVAPTIFDIPSDKLELPYSGINRLGSFNEGAFQDFVALFPPAKNWSNWVDFAAFLSKDQINVLKREFTVEKLGKLEVSQMVRVLPVFFLDLSERGAMALQLIEIVKKKDISAASIKAEVSLLGNYLDIRDVDIRQMFETNLPQPSIEARVASIIEFVTASNAAESVEETIKTLNCILPRVKNEMRLNMDQIFWQLNNHIKPSFYANYTVDQAKKMVPIYEALNSNNLSAVSVSPPLQNFIQTLASQMLAFYIGTPSHPFFQFGIDVLWAIQIHVSGSSQNISFNHGFSNPWFDSTRPDLEILRRQAIARGQELVSTIKRSDQTEQELLEQLGGPPFGLFMIPEGQEDAIVTQIVETIQTKFLTVGDEKEPIDFLDSLCANQIFSSLRKALALRWSKSSLLMNYYNRCVATLEKAPRVKYGDEEVLDWAGSLEARAFAFVQESTKWAPQQPKLAERLSTLTLRSTHAGSEASRIYSKCKDASEEEKFVEQLFEISPSGSALHMPWVMEYVLSNKPCLLKPEHISEKRAFLGLFNNSPEARLVFVLTNRNEISPLPGDTLLPWQADLLMTRYWEEALDKKLPMNDRVMAISRMMHMPNVSVNDAAAFLVADSLPPRVKEAVLMFLPKIDEPASSINLMTLPVFLQSDLARTAIFGVKNVLSYMSQDRLISVLEGLIPPPGGKGVKVGVFKEITRLVGEFCHIPRVLDILQNLWERENLHKDVRISLLQKVVSLLADRNEDISNTAWKIVLDCVHGPWYEQAGQVLVMGKKETARFYPQQVIVYGRIYSSYTYGDLSHPVIFDSIASRYGLEVSVPMALRLYERVKVLKKNDATYVDLLNRMIHSFWNICSFVSVDNADGISRALAPMFKESMASSMGDLANERFGCLSVILGECAGTLANTDSQVEVPFAWTEIVNCAQQLTKEFFNFDNSIQVRMSAKNKLLELKLGSEFIPKPEIKCQALAKAVMAPIAAMNTVPGASKYFWDVKFDREICHLTHVCGLLERFPTEFEVYFASTLAIVDQLLVELIKNGFEAAEFGAIELDKDALTTRLDQIYRACGSLPDRDRIFKDMFESKTWCEDVPGFDAFRSDFRFMLIRQFSILNTPTAFVKFATELVVSNDPCLDRIWDQLSTMFNSHFDTLIALHKKCEATNKEPLRKNVAALDAMLALLVNISSSSRFESKQQPLAKFFKAVLSNQTEFLLERLPGVSAKFIVEDSNSSLSSLQDTWFAYLGRCFTNNERSALKHPVTGVAGIRPILERIVKAARDCSFDENLDETIRFESVVSHRIGLALHICPDIADYLVSKPWSSSGKALLYQISNIYGPEAVCMYLEALLDGRAAEVDLVELMRLGHPDPKHVQITTFPLSVEAYESKKKPELVQTASSKAERSKLASVHGAAQYFIDSRQNAHMRVVSSFANYLNNKESQSSLKSSGLDALNGIPRIGSRSTEPSKETIAFVTSQMTIELAKISPYLYFFWISVTIQELQPFQLPQWVSLFAMQARVSTLSSQVFPSAAPIQYLIDVARTLVHTLAPWYEKAGQQRVASGLRLVAVNMLTNIHAVTQESCFSTPGVMRKTTKLVDLLVLEAAEERDGEMVIGGYKELLDALLTTGNRAVFEAVCRLQNAQWQLKWKV